MRTLSKMGLAGLRLGFLAGPLPWLEQIEKIRLPYNINVLTQVSAEFALRHQAVFDRQTQAIKKARAKLYEELKSIAGVTAYPSEANFILLRLPAGCAATVHKGLSDRGLLVKNLHGAHPALDECLRVTVGTEDENRAFLHALRATLKA